MIIRRLSPQPDAALCVGGQKCPGVFELVTTGDFAVIGTNITEQASNFLPAGSDCGPNECIVRVPRRTLVEARPEIPAAL